MVLLVSWPSSTIATRTDILIKTPGLSLSVFVNNVITDDPRGFKRLWARFLKALDITPNRAVWRRPPTGSSSALDCNEARFC